MAETREAADAEWGMRDAQKVHRKQDQFLPGWMDEAEKVNNGAGSVDKEFRERVGVEPDEDEYEGYDNRGPHYETNNLGLRSTGRLPENADANKDAGPGDGYLGQGWAGDKGERYEYGARERTAPTDGAAASDGQGKPKFSATGGGVQEVKPTRTEAEKNFKEPTDPIKKELAPGVSLSTTKFVNMDGKPIGMLYEVETNREMEFTIDISGSTNMQVSIDAITNPLSLYFLSSAACAKFSFP